MAPMLRKRLKEDRISMGPMMPSYNHVASTVRSNWEDMKAPMG